MAKYRVKVHVELVECDDTVNHEPKKITMEASR